MNRPTLFAIVSVLCLIGCGRQPSATPSPQPEQIAVQRAARKPQLTRDEVLQRFRERATPDQLREFEQLRASTDPESRARALSLVLFRLTGEELFKIGITQAGGRTDWAVAGSSDKAGAMEAVGRLLETEHISLMGSCNHGMCAWYVPREQFFRARQVLLAATNLTGLGVSVFEPLITLDE